MVLYFIKLENYTSKQNGHKSQQSNTVRERVRSYKKNMGVNIISVILSYKQ